MITGLGQIALMVDEYDAAKDFYCGKLGFVVAEDTLMPTGSRWVRLKAPGGQGAEILLARAVDDRQRAAVGNQTGGRVLFFLYTDNFDSDYDLFRSRGVEFTETPRDQVYGKVVVFKDLYGNRIDLIQPRLPSNPL